jgi:hypothetical protein
MTRRRKPIRIKCPKCGLYISPLYHPDEACKLVQALYPMLKEGSK